MLILDRYVVREVARPLLVVLGVLVIIFAGYSGADYLARAASGTVKPDTVLLLIALKVAIGLEVLLPIALYLTVVVGLGRLIANREFAAMAICGFGRGAVLGALLRLFLVVSLLVGALSLYVRPLAYRLSYRLRARAEATFDLSDIKAGRFYGTARGHRTVYVGGIDDRSDTLKLVLMWLDEGTSTTVIRAREASRTTDQGTGAPALAGRHVRLWFPDQNKGPISTRMEGITMKLGDADTLPLEYKRKAASTAHLMKSSAPKDRAELQWRLTRPLSAFLLGILGVVLSRGRPRRDRYSRIVGAVLAYAAYYEVQIMARNQVESGAVGATPGLWWVDVLFLLILLLLLFVPWWLRRPSLRGQRVSSP